MGKTKKRYIDTYDQVSIHRVCKYIGSFAINMMKSEERKKLVNERLQEFKKVKKGVPVVLQVATSGIKVFDENEQAIKMAHSIVGITFSTYSKSSRLFSYVAKSSVHAQDSSILQAHVFKTRKGSHAKKEIARGHANSEHAIYARKIHPLEIIPGPSLSIDQDILRKGDNGVLRRSSNVMCQYQRVPRQNSETVGLSQRLVVGQMHSVTSNGAATPPKKHKRALSPINDTEFELSNRISAADNRVDDQEASSDVQAVGNKAEEVFEDAQTSDDSEDDEVYTAEDDLKEGRLQIVPTDRAVLEDSYWYQPGLPRGVAEEMLQVAMPGTFFIHNSTNKPGFFTLSMKVPYAIRESGIANILIERDSNGDFTMPGLRNSFQSLPLLVAYYASFGHELPVRLRLTYDEDPSAIGNNDSSSGVAAKNDVPTASAGPDARIKSPEEEAVDTIDAILANDPDFALYANCEPILNELNAL